MSLYTESVKGNNNKARWPYDTSLERDKLYDTVMTNLKQEKLNSEEPCVFKGWRYRKNDEIRQEPFNNESSNPFGPIKGNTTIPAVWSRLYVFCTTFNNSVEYQGGSVVVTYYAVTDEQISSDEVILKVNEELTTVNEGDYQIGQSSVYDNCRVCTITFNQNNGTEGRDLFVYAEYKGVKSQVLNIHQKSQYEITIEDCDYFHFTYSWDDIDGKDLDSLTVIYVEDKNGERVNLPFTGKPVGYGTQTYEINSGNILCMKHSRDNQLSGAEGAIVCLTNIANTHQVADGQKIIVEIYANWYAERKSGDMRITCKGYKSKLNQPSFSEDINVETIRIQQEGKTYVYDEFSPNENNCDEVWTRNDEFNVSAFGNRNAHIAKDIECAGEIYSNICTVTYLVGGNPNTNKTYIPRTVDNGVDGSKEEYKFSVCSDVSPWPDYQKSFNLGTDDTELHTVNGLYISDWERNGDSVGRVISNIFSDSEDYVEISMTKSSNQELDQDINIKIKANDIGSGGVIEYGTAQTVLFNSFKITKRGDDKLNIEFELIPYEGQKRSIYINLYKHYNDCRPYITTTAFGIYQKP